MINDFLHLVVRANLAASLAIAAVAVLRRALRSAFGVSTAYGLWGIPLIAAGASLVPAPHGGPIAPIVLGAMDRLPASGLLQAGAVWPAGLGGAWALGVLACAAVLGTQQVRFAFALRGASRASMAGTFVLRAPTTDIGPAVVAGAIVLPSDFEARFSPAEQAAIIAHEAQHLARGDVIANAAVALVQCLCWFNPLVHLAAHWIRVDQELACDAAVIAGRPSLRRPYAEALLKAPMMAAVPPAGCAWRAHGFRALRDRIRLLKQRRPGAPRRICGVLVLALLTVGGGYAAWAAQPSQGRVVTNPAWISLPNGDDLARLYPRKASARGREGMAVMRCRVDTSGGLSDCAIVRETPRGFGFGAATLGMAPRFRMKPMSVDGRPVGGASVVIPVKFKLAAKDAERR